MIAHGIKAALPREDVFNQAVRFAVGIGGLLRAMRQASQERAQLLALSERDLRDIGISRVDAVRIASQPLWRFNEVPSASTDRIGFYRQRGEALRVRAIGDAVARFGRFVTDLLRFG